MHYILNLSIIQLCSLAHCQTSLLTPLILLFHLPNFLLLYFHFSNFTCTSAFAFASFLFSPLVLSSSPLCYDLWPPSQFYRKTRVTQVTLTLSSQERRLTSHQRINSSLWIWIKLSLMVSPTSIQSTYPMCNANRALWVRLPWLPTKAFWVSLPGLKALWGSILGRNSRVPWLRGHYGKEHHGYQQSIVGKITVRSLFKCTCDQSNCVWFSVLWRDFDRHCQMGTIYSDVTCVHESISQLQTFSHCVLILISVIMNVVWAKYILDSLSSISLKVGMPRSKLHVLSL